jgi:hypothetical protein
MVLDPYQIGYFIEQVGLAAASFGVAKSDINVVATALETLFGYRCAPKTTVIEAEGAQYQSICTDEKCPLAMNSTCAAQPIVPRPLIPNKTQAAGKGKISSMSASASAAGYSSSSAASKAAVQHQAGVKSFLKTILAFFAL